MKVVQTHLATRVFCRVMPFSCMVLNNFPTWFKTWEDMWVSEHRDEHFSFCLWLSIHQDSPSRPESEVLVFNSPLLVGSTTSHTQAQVTLRVGVGNVVSEPRPPGFKP